MPIKKLKAIVCVEYSQTVSNLEFKKYNVDNTKAGIKSFELFVRSMQGSKHINYYEKQTGHFIKQVKVS